MCVLFATGLWYVYVAGECEDIRPPGTILVMGTVCPYTTWLKQVTEPIKHILWFSLLPHLHNPILHYQFLSAAQNTESAE